MSLRSDQIAACEEILGHRFADASRLVLALTHPSSTDDKLQDNERLEFLGDSILDLIIGEVLYERRPDLREGQLTRIRANLVCRQALARVTRSLGMEPYFILGKGIVRSGRTPDSVFANVYEALVAAIYLDGDLDAARRFVLQSMAPWLDDPDALDDPENYKSILQQRLQAEGRGLPRYSVKSATGPDHDKTFVLTVQIDGVQAGTGTGGNKKRAEQAAAKAALQWLDGLADAPSAREAGPV